MTNQIHQFTGFAEESKLWVFGLDRSISNVEKEQLVNSLKSFLATWKAHGASVVGDVFVDFDRFIVISADSGSADTSGCSIDALFREVSAAAKLINAKLLSGSHVFFRHDGEVQVEQRDKFANGVAQGKYDDTLPVFDLTITSLKEYRRAGLERRAADTWHKKAFFS